MKTRQSVRWIMAGAAALALGACDAVNSRIDQLGDLTGQVMRQLGGESAGPTQEQILAAAPLESRALFGVLAAPEETAPVSLEEAMQTQSFFAVGSVIAKPRETIVEPVVEPDSFDPDDVAPDAEPPPPPPAAASPDEPEPQRSMSAAPAPAPAPEQMVMAAPPAVSAPTDLDLRRQADIAPRALARDLKRSGAHVSTDTLRTARQAAEQSVTADTRTAQIIGDDIARKSRDAAAPVPKMMAVRSKLDVDKALSVRERTYNKLEEMGLSGVVTPDEGGTMRILIGVEPSRYTPQDLSKIDAMRERFARKRERREEECSGRPSAERMRSDPILATECVVKVLQESGDYEYVEKDFIFTNQMLKKPKPTATLGAQPNDPLFGLQWHFKPNGTGAGQSPGGASFSDFWTRAKLTGSRDVTVAVIDTGIQLAHPDIAGSPNLAPGYDMVSDPLMGNDGDGRDNDPNDPGDRCDPNDPTSRDSFHGTHVAGTVGVAASNNASGVAGGAWDVTVVPVRALGRCGGKLSDINDAIRWAAGKVPARDAQGDELWNEHPADIINLSIGLFEPCPASMQAAIDDAVAAGAIVVTAAGNARVDAKYFAPASCANVISVAAGDARGVLSPYSNFGEGVTLMAPGGDMTRDDDGDGRPDGVLSTKFATDCYDPANPDVAVAECFYAFESGTSMAAPHVSAALALLKAKFPSAVPSELKSRLLAASTPRTQLQCSGKCSQYPGTEPVPGQDGMCFRPCGGAMLNLANAPVE